MSQTRTLLAAPFLSLMLACPPEEPPSGDHPEAAIDLRNGEWTLLVEDVELEGRCDGADARDIVGAELPATFRIERPRALVELDGAVLEGQYDGRKLSVSGAPGLEGHGESEGDPGEGEGVPPEACDTGDEEGGAPPPPCETVDEPGGEPDPSEGAEIWAELELVASSPTEAEGWLFVSYDMPGFRCELDAKVDALHGGPSRPHDDDVDPSEPHDEDDVEWGDDDGDEDHG